MARSKSPAHSDPLIAAMISKLPDSGKEFTPEQQLAWLNMMAMAFGTVYGGEVRLGSAQNVAPAAPAKQTIAPPKAPHLAYQFHIDEHGHVRSRNGKPVLPSEVTSEIFDRRGQEGDLRALVRADGSTGLNGRELTIMA